MRVRMRNIGVRACYMCACVLQEHYAPTLVELKAEPFPELMRELEAPVTSDSPSDSLLAVFGDCHAQAAAQSEDEDELDQKARADFAEQRCNELRRRSTVAKEQALAATDAATLGDTAADADADADATRRRSESATARMAGFTVKRRISGAVGNEANARLVPASRRASVADESVAASGMRLAR